jgi:hypothetical protein
MALFILGAAVIAVIASFARTPDASACGGPPPRPLRALYLESDRIVVAHIGETVPMEISFEAYYRKTTLKTTLYVTSTLKGEGDHYTLYVYHDNWVFSGDVEQQDAQAKRNDFSGYTPDDTLLVFLQRRKDGEDYEMADATYCVKKLTDADLKIYTQRIEELAAIMLDAEPDNARLVEWLVRCAEEPATRWEGAYELAATNRALYDRSDEAKESEDESGAEAVATDASEENIGGEDANGAGAEPGITDNAAETTVEDGAAGEDNAVENKLEEVTAVEQPVEEKIAARRFWLDSPEFAKLLTDEQKTRLADALFSAKTLGDNEAILIEIVKHGDDPRLVPFILAYLHTVVEEPPYMAQEMLTLVAEKLNNKSLIELAQRYCENALYYDPEESSGDSAVAEAQEAGDTGQQVEPDPEEKALRGTSVQKRSARLKRFLASADNAPAK